MPSFFSTILNFLLTYKFYFIAVIFFLFIAPIFQSTAGTFSYEKQAADSTTTGITFIVIPVKYTSREGPDSTLCPFSLKSAIFRRIYSYKDFPSGKGPISSIAFRARSSTSVHSPLMPVSIRNVSVVLFTTKAFTNKPVNVIDDKSSSNIVSVYKGPAKLSTAYFRRKKGGPCAFDLRFRFQTLYYYNPRNERNLCIIIKVNSGSSAIPLLDADRQGPITQFTFGTFSVFPNIESNNKKIGWIINRKKLIEIQKIKYPDGTTLANYFFNNPFTLIIGQHSKDPRPKGWSKSVPLAAYQSFKHFEDELCNGELDTIYHVVMYDNEHWPKTPENEQENPKDYYALFANLAHAYGYSFIATPSPNIQPYQKNYDSNKPMLSQFFSMGLSESCANSPAEIYNIQSQTFEGFPHLFASFINKSISQARDANPRIIIFAGIGSTPAAGLLSADCVKWGLIKSQLPGKGHYGRRWQVSPKQILNAVLKTHKIVEGYWLNIPVGNVQTAFKFLKLLKDYGF